jgi:hypothetical protein
MTPDPSRFMRAAAGWLTDERYELVHLQDELLESNVSTWSGTLRTLGRQVVVGSLNPNSLYIKTAKTFYRQFDQVQVNEDRLDEALSPYLQTAAVTGVKLGRLSEGNTRVVAMLQGDHLAPADVDHIARSWLDQAPAMQAIGRSPGQTYGEIALGMFTWGITGFRVHQPAEIYPIVVYFDRDRYRAAKDDVLRNSVREYIPERTTVGSHVARKAPVYLQAIVACVPTQEVAFLADRHESRRAWRHYKKPKLAERVFTRGTLQTLLQAADTG